MKIYVKQSDFVIDIPSNSIIYHYNDTQDFILYFSKIIASHINTNEDVFINVSSKSYESLKVLFNDVDENIACLNIDNFIAMSKFIKLQIFISKCIVNYFSTILKFLLLKERTYQYVKKGTNTLIDSYNSVKSLKVSLIEKVKNVFSI